MRRCLWGLLALAACGADVSTPADAGDQTDSGAVPGDAGALDLGFVDGAVPNPVEVGTGADGFMPLATGDTVRFEQGPQGGGRLMGFHIWGAVRAKGFAPQGALVRMRYLSLPNREVIGLQERMVTLQPDGDAFVAYGFATRMVDCCAILSQRIIMRAEIQDRNGQTGADEREVMTEAACIDNTTQTNVCP